MRPGFTISVDARGDLYATEGTVIDQISGVIFTVATPPETMAGVSGGLADHLADATDLPAAENAVLLGGSGRNLVLSGLAIAAGFWQPGRPGFWTFGDLILEVTGSSAATISDDTDVVAILSSGGTAPVGSFASTSYGQTTYNGGSAFTLTAVGETGWPGAIPDIDVTISEGTAVGGLYEATDATNYVCAADPDWTIEVLSDGSAEMRYDGTVVAIRPTGLADDPCGLYESTEAGKMLNPVFPDAEDEDAPDTNPFGILTLEFNWSGAPDLDIGVEFLGATVGYGYSASSTFMTWSGDNTTDGGPETVDIDLGAAWDAGEITTFADVLALADWYPPAGGSGPASLVVTYDGGTPETIILHPGSATPATNPALALRILADGTFAAVGEEWTATVRAVRRAPVEGVVYLAITEAAGAVTAVSEPAFATALPTNTAGVTHYPLATSDGDGGLRQIHAGPLFWTAERAARSIQWGTVASSTADGAQGEVRMDGTYIYGCVATDTWARLEWDLTAFP